MARSKQDLSGVLICIETFHGVDAAGGPLCVYKGEVRPANAVAKAYAGYFRPVEGAVTHDDVEDASADPGVRRGVEDTSAEPGVKRGEHRQASAQD